MKTPFNPSAPDFEERMDSWLSTQPLTPAPDFVARTMARIRAEASLVTAARAGDDAALDALLDRWLGEQPIDAAMEPEQLVISTRRTATREEQEESRPQTIPGRRLIPFPAWARSAVALAAAACVALLGYLNLNTPVGSFASQGDAARNVATDSESLPTAHYAWNSDPNYISDLSSSLKDLAPVANSNDLDAITNAFGNDDIVN